MFFGENLQIFAKICRFLRKSVNQQGSSADRFLDFWIFAKTRKLAFLDF